MFSVVFHVLSLSLSFFAYVTRKHFAPRCSDYITAASGCTQKNSLAVRLPSFLIPRRTSVRPTVTSLGVYRAPITSARVTLDTSEVDQSRLKSVQKAAMFNARLGRALRRCDNNRSVLRSGNLLACLLACLPACLLACLLSFLPPACFDCQHNNDSRHNVVPSFCSTE